MKKAFQHWLSVISDLKTIIGKWHTVISIILTLAIGYIAFCYFGMVPESIAVPLPWHSRYCMLPSIAADYRTDRNELVKKQPEKTVKKNTFDKLCSVSPFSARLHMAVDGGKNYYCYLPSAGISYVKPKGEDTFRRITGGIVFTKSKYQYHIILAEGENKQVIGRNTDLDENDYQAHLQCDIDADYRGISALLSKQSTQKITNNELSTLLYSRCFGELIGWFPEDNAAIFALGDTLLRVNVRTGEETELANPYAGKSTEYIGCADPDTVYMSLNGIAIVRLRFSTQESYGIELDQPFDAAFLYKNDKGTYFALIRKPTEAQKEQKGSESFKICMIYNWENDSYGAWWYINGPTYGEEIYFTKDRIFTLSLREDNENDFYYSIGENSLEG